MDAEEIRIRLMMAEENRDSYKAGIVRLTDSSTVQTGMAAIRLQLYYDRHAHWEQRVKDLRSMLAEVSIRGGDGK